LIFNFLKNNDPTSEQRAAKVQKIICRDVSKGQNFTLCHKLTADNHYKETIKDNFSEELMRI